MVGVTRWKDRVTSSSGDWSGNLFDFIFKVLPKLQADLKVPFVLKGNQRVDDTRFGERAGSGLNGIMHVWRKVYHTEAIINESTEDIDRTTLTLPFNGNEPDIDAMLNLYDDAEDIMIPNEGDNLSGKETAELLDKMYLSGKNGQELPDKSALSGKIVEQINLSGNLKGKEQITESLIDKLTDICIYISQHPHSAKEDIAAFIKRSDETAKKLLQTLVAIGWCLPSRRHRLLP